MNLKLPVGQGTRVYLNFSLKLEDGSVIDTNFDSEPVGFVVGDGSLLPSFERLLFGMMPGESQRFSVTPENAFGMPNSGNIQRMNRVDFDDGMELQLGLVVSFADASGAELPGVIVDIGEEEVSVDFNHPLVGRTIIFDVSIHTVEAAELH